MMTHGQSPTAQQVLPEWRNKIIHARMTVGGTVLMGSDALSDR
jgi:PhnB protein